MPYLAFQTTKGAKVEFSGNNLAQFTAAIEKHGDVAYPQLALDFVKAFFLRRELQVKKQKAILAEDEEAADAADEELEPAEDEEARSKDAYTKACNGEGSSSSAAAAPVEPKKEEDPYAYLKPAEGSSSAPVDDDFM